MRPVFVILEFLIGNDIKDLIPSAERDAFIHNCLLEEICEKCDNNCMQITQHNNTNREPIPISFFCKEIFGSQLINKGYEQREVDDIIQKLIILASD